MSITIKSKEITPCNDCALYKSCKDKKNEHSEDICLWSVIHYIVKDYRRMFKKEEKHKLQLEKKEEKIRELTRFLKMKQVEALSDEKISKMIKNFSERAERLKSHNEKLQKTVDILYAQVEDTKNSRNAVVEEVTSDLRDELKEANNKIEHLVQAVVSPDKASSLTLHTIEAKEDKKWMLNAMKQLEKAFMKLIKVEESLSYYEEMLKDNGNEFTKGIVKKVNKAMNDINSTLSHIECFMEKIGTIKIVDSDED